MEKENRSKALHITLWVVQGLLAVAFGMAGFMKLTMPIEQLAENGMTFVNHYSAGVVRFIGASEVLAAIGFILPAALRIMPFLTPLAAVGIAIVMILAFFEHISQNEPIVANVVLFVLAIFVAWGRFLKVPVRPK
jgi:putative oxidoreductase